MENTNMKKLIAAFAILFLVAACSATAPDLYPADRQTGDNHSAQAE